MKLTLKKESFISRRFIGFNQIIDLNLDFMPLYAEFLAAYNQIKDIQLISNKIYFEIINNQVNGPKFEINGIPKNFPNNLILEDFRKGEVYKTQILEINGNLEAISQNWPMIMERINLIASKISFKKVLFSLELDKIELHFFNY